MGKLFKLFGKLERTTDVNLEGTGIGLTICQKIVKNNKGAIDVFSKGVNRGSNFMFSMKMIEPQKKSKPVAMDKISEEELEESIERSARSISIDESHPFFDHNVNNLSNI